MNQASSDSLLKSVSSALAFAILVIGPPAALLNFAHGITQNPLLTLLIIGAYEVCVFLFRFTSKVWGKLEDSVAEYFAHAIRGRSQAYLSHYHRNYYKHVVYEHQVLDIKGLSTRTAHDLALEHVFVDLRIDSKPSHQVSVNPVEVPQTLQGKRSIWDFLSSSDLRNAHLVILGSPGSGKTTLLKHLALTIAQPKKYRARSRLRYRFPLLLFLRDHVSKIIDQADTFSLAQALQDHMQRQWQQSIPAEWVERHLKKGGCLVLLDGLDEVADPQKRRQVVGWVQRQLQAYGSTGRNRFLLTSRPYGYRENPLKGVTTLEVQPFLSEQIEQFIHNWYLANELKSWGKDDPGVHQRARKGASDLINRLHRVPALLALAVNPLLLTMIATVHRYRSSLPGKRVDLYAEICEVFLGKRAEAGGVPQDLSPAQKRDVLQPLAYSMMQQGKRETSAEEVISILAQPLSLVSNRTQPIDFLLDIQNTSGLLLERDPGTYAFAHLSFQEYLASVYIKENILEQDLTAQVKSSWWHETIRLYCAQTDATNLILACLQGKLPTIAALTLAFECDEEKLKIQPEAQKQLNTIINTGIEDPDPERGRIFGEAFLTRRLRQMVHLSKGVYVSTSLLTCAEYQLFLNEQQQQGKWYQPDHWQEETFRAGEGHFPVLGVRHLDALAFCEWLTQRDMEGWSYRLPTAQDDIASQEDIVNRLNEHTGYWMSPFTNHSISSWKGDQSRFMWAKGKPSSSIKRRIGELLTSDFDFARARDLDHARDFDFDFAFDHARDFDFALDHALDHARDHARDRDLAIDLDFACFSARDLAPDQASRRTHGLGFVLDQASRRALWRAHDLGSALDHARARSSAHDLARVRDLARAGVPVRASAHVSDPDLELASAHVLALELARDHARAGVRDHNFAHTRAGVRDHVLARDHALDLYIILYLLAKRREGNLPAYEGILLVKEEGKVSPTSTIETSS